MRKYCPRTRKNGITTTDIWGRSSFRSSKRSGCDRSIYVCGLNGPGCGDEYFDECFDPERMWCLRQDCSVFECNQLWWKKKKEYLERELDVISENLSNVLDFLSKYEEMDDIDKDGLKDLNNYKTYCFLRDLKRSFGNSRFEMPQEGLDMMEHFYRQVINNEDPDDY